MSRGLNPSRYRRASVRASCLVAPLALSACAPASAPPDSGHSAAAADSAPAAETVLYFPRQAKRGLAMQAAFTGRLGIRNGCLVLGDPDGETIVWNESARLGADGRSVTDTRTGETARVGERIRLGGGKVMLDQWGRGNLAQPFPDQCSPDVIVVGEGFRKMEE
ncbi:MAG TPA: hypothetical protein VFZ91_13280 [Allosphingosinicella sp.]